MTHPLRHQSLRVAIGHALLCLGLGLCVIPAVAAAEPASAIKTYSLSIAAGSLDAALTRLSRDTGVSIAFEQSDLAGKRSPAVQGDLSVAEAMSRLLAGSGLQAMALGEGGYRLVPATDDSAALQLGATSITSSALGQATEGSGSYTTGSMSTATKLPLSIRETPQSVSVIGRQQIEDQGLVTINDAAMKTPGLSMQKIGAERYNLYSRGFAVDSIMYDGLPSVLDASADTITPANLAMYDRIEVVRGANGLVQGSGNPSAAINLVRKRPTSSFQSSIGLSAGSWDNYRSELDVSGPLSENGKLRGRAVATYQDGNSFQDGLGKEHSLFYAIGEADITDLTTLAVSYTHQNENNDVAWGGGLPTAVDGSDLHLSRSTSFLADWDYWDKEMDALFVELKHELANDWSVRLAANRTWSTLDYFGGYPGRTTSNLGTLAYRVSGGKYDDTQNSYDAYLSGPFQLLGRTHELVLGYSYRDVDYNSHGSAATNAGVIGDPHAPDPGSWVKPNVSLYDFRDNRDMTQQGVYSTARFSLTDRLKLITGARLDWYDYQYIYNWRGDISTTEAKATRHLTRYAGLLYDLDQWHTLYASYTDIFQPQSSRDAGGQLIEPIEGKTYELGIKGEYFDGALNASVAVFQIDQENRASEVDDPTRCSTYPSTTCYEATGKVQSRGIEAEISGAVTPDWQLSAGYTYAAAKIRKDANPDNEGRLFDTDIPRHQIKLTTMYRLPGSLDRWRVGGSFYRQSSVFNEGVTGGQSWKIEQGSYNLVDLMSTYQASEHLDMRFALNNLFDKTYYQTIGQNVSSWPTTFYGAPRNFQVSATYRF